MKKTLILFAIAAVTLGMASCEKDNNTDAKDLRFTAILEGSEKTSLNDANDNLTWNSSGETITVSNTSGSTNYMATYSATPGTNARIATFGHVSGTLASGVTSRRAFYPANITTDGVHITLPQVQHSTNGELAGYPMYTESENETLLFKNLCAVLKLNLQENGENVKKIQIITDQTVNGTFSVNYNDGDPILTPTSDDDHTKIITMEFETAVDISNGKTFQIYIPKNTYNYMKINVYDDNGLLFTKSTNTAITFNRSKYKTLTFSHQEITFHPYTLNGRFSVAPNKQVFFASSNLIKNGTTGEYRFAKNIGYANTSNYSSTATNITLFNFAEASQSSYDITNAGGTAAGWYNMPSTEWNYLANTRTMTNGFQYRWSLFKISYQIDNNGEPYDITKPGLVLFPDDFVWPLDNSRMPQRFGSYTEADWCGISLTLAEWNVMQDAGCVFLPVTGYVSRTNSSSNRVSNTNWGFYWTSQEGNQTGAYGDSYYTYFTPRHMYFTGEQHFSPNNLLAVRLVKVAQ